MKKELVAFLFAFVCAGFALDITTRTGTVYRKCEVVNVEPDGIRISHDGGAAKLTFEELPDALQRQYGFDRVKVAAYRKAIADAKAAVEAKANAEAMQARVQAEEARQKQAAIVRAAESQRIASEREAAEKMESEQLQQKKEAQLEKDREARNAALTAIGVIGAYFLPSIVGILRGKSNWLAICVLNLLLGWTLVGWVIALVWALTKDLREEMQAVVDHNRSQPYSAPRNVVKIAQGKVVDPRRLPPRG